VFKRSEDATEAQSDWLAPEAPGRDAATGAPGEAKAEDAHRPAEDRAPIGHTVGDLGRGLDPEGAGGPMGMREGEAVGSPSGGHYPGDADGCTENSYRKERNQRNPEELRLPRAGDRQRLDDKGR
jgi:hypothetical protein